MRIARAENNAKISLPTVSSTASLRMRYFRIRRGEDHEEVNFKDLRIEPRKAKSGYERLRFRAERAACDDL